MPRKRPNATPENWRSRIRQYIDAHPDRPLRARALGRAVSVPDESYADFRREVREMLERGELALGRGRTLHRPAVAGTLVGVFHAAHGGFGFVQIADRPDMFVPRHSTAGALDGDQVRVRLLPERRRGAPPGAEVVRIVKRAPLRWIGVLEQHRGHWSVRPQDRVPRPIVAVEEPAANAREGELVVAEVDSRHLDGGVVRGSVAESLGRPDSAAAQVEGVIRRYNLRDEFPRDVRAAAEHARGSSLESSLAGRRDLRELTTITIDPPDARDFDDAISIERTTGGGFRLGVHIADVAHFVTTGDAVDEEARLRGTSVYLPGRCLPMLPEALSNDACSLRPGEDRATMSVFIDYDSAGVVVDARFAPSLIRSSARLAYPEASSALENPDDRAMPPRVLSTLRDAETLARRIQKRRAAGGMISLALPEVALTLAADGRVIDARAAETSYSHTIIEMFMIEANEAVSRFLHSRGVAHARRIHPPPDFDGSRRTLDILRGMGLAPPRTLDRPGVLEILGKVRGKPTERVVSYLLLRCLPQAYYGADSLGHFALASAHYAHFTSPIRRYPDLLVHRALRAILLGRPPTLSDSELQSACVAASQTERAAQQAERDARAALLLQFLTPKLGEVCDGVIAGMTSRGAYVQIQPYLAEGFLNASEFGDGAWTFDRRACSFTDLATDNTMVIGQAVRVQLAAVDNIRQQLQLTLAVGHRPGTRVSAARPARNVRVKRKKRGHQEP